MEISSKEFKVFIENTTELMESNKEYLCDLDRKLGDGDHGVTMSIGWQAVKNELSSSLASEEDCGKISKIVGMTFLNAVGSSVGPLYATGFLRGGKVVENKTKLNDEDLHNYWIAFIEGVKERGNATVGDKTMMDTLIPALDSLKENSNDNFQESFEKALNQAEEGMKSTTDMIAKIGRSSRLGERSIGFQDPGATSAFLILKEFLNTVKKVDKD